jgi:hypothetical protein
MRIAELPRWRKTAPIHNVVLVDGTACEGDKKDKSLQSVVEVLEVVVFLSIIVDLKKRKTTRGGREGR